jgi:hypothetical protein
MRREEDGSQIRDFNHVLATPVLYQKFVQFMTAEFCVENLVVSKSSIYKFHHTISVLEYGASIWSQQRAS